MLFVHPPAPASGGDDYSEKVLFPCLVQFLPNLWAELTHQRNPTTAMGYRFPPLAGVRGWIKPKTH